MNSTGPVRCAARPRPVEKFNVNRTLSNTAGQEMSTFLTGELQAHERAISRASKKIYLKQVCIRFYLRFFLTGMVFAGLYILVAHARRDSGYTNQSGRSNALQTPHSMLSHRACTWLLRLRIGIRDQLRSSQCKLAGGYGVVQRRWRPTYG
ncbi:hypothetical protein SALB1_3067 [Salinisphaera sp. LB1]|nr:hypothetical protein SALB1_3067 [Salinisphaera sp. LB1]